LESFTLREQGAKQDSGVTSIQQSNLFQVQELSLILRENSLKNFFGKDGKIPTNYKVLI
jgi:hypothetical protein